MNYTKMLQSKLTLVFLSAFLTINGHVECSTDLAPEFYKPGNGVFMEQWFFSSTISINKMDEPPFSDDCPPFARNLDNFEFRQAYSKYQNIIARAYFTSSQTGNHVFFAICDDNCALELYFPQYGVNRILLTIESYVRDDWTYRVSAPAQFLEKDVRYLLRLRYYGRGGVDVFRIGVKLPDNSEMKPIPKEWLWRSMEFYSWNGLLGRYYKSIAFPSSRKLSDFLSTNSAVFPNSPSYHTCLNNLYQASTRVADYFAIMYIGYVKLPKSANYDLQLRIDSIGEVNITKSNTVELTGTNDIVAPVATYDFGYFNASKYYPIKLIQVEKDNSEFIRIQYRATGDSYSSNWLGLLRNLIDVVAVLPTPEVSVTGSFNISVTLTDAPYLPKSDNWAYNNRYRVRLYKKEEGESGTVLGFEYASASFPTTSMVNGLEAYTEYCAFIEYHGLMKNTVQHNIFTTCKTLKTKESVPESPPSGINVRVKSSTSVNVNWQHLVDVKLLRGIRAGYEVIYAIKNVLPKNWTSVIIAENVNRLLITSLEEYTEYEVKVAARTSKGSGVFSSAYTVKTREDKPSAAPSDISGHNTSATSIIVHWKDVPIWHQNGVVTNYMVYYKKIDDSVWKTKQVNEPSKSLIIEQLDLWQIYEIRISAFTSVGEGPQSISIRVRTDEDKPVAAPSVVNATAVSSRSINVIWSDIDVSKAYGNIIEYTIKYKRTDGQDSEKEVTTQYRNILINGLDSHISYDIKVAGSTRKGYGPFSDVVQETTLESEPTSPPTDVRGMHINSTALRILWGAIPIKHRNGIIIEYKIQYRESETVTKGHGKWENLTVAPSELAANIAHLRYYTPYDIRVAGVNAVGIGVYCAVIVVRTDADGPGRPPMNLTGNFVSHNAIEMHWFRVPEPFRFGTILGYKLRYADKTMANLTWIELTIPNRIGGNDSFNFTISNLKIYTPYIFDIAAFTYKAVGVYSDKVTVWTDEYIPSKSPSNVTAQNGSSTDIVLHWKEMGENHDNANGEVLGYIVKYRVLDCHEDRPAGCDEKDVFNITSYGKNATVMLSNLRKYTSYEVSIQVFNSKGKGMFSKSINVTTGEDKPDASPTFSESWPSAYDSLDVYWSPIPESLRNGIIQGYRIFYKPIDTPQRKYERAPRAVDPLAIYGALPGEKMKEVNSTTFKTRLTGLKDYSWYSIRVGAFTSKGLGPTVKMNGTCKQSTPVTAPILTVIDKYSLTEMSLKWTKINETGSKGEVLGYRITYWLNELNYDPVLSSVVTTTDVFAPNRTATLVNLKPFARYAIQISAFTEAGFGIQSKIYYGDTCRCAKMISSAIIKLKPLVNDNFLSSNLLGQIVADAIVSCCGNCSRGHGISYVDWSKDANNATSLKHSPQSLVEAAQDGTNVALPVFHSSDSTIEDVYGSLKYVPVAPVTKMLVFRNEIPNRVLGNAASSTVLQSLLEQYPLYAISMLITIIAGILFWIFESGVNKEEFSSAFSRGCGSGFWLAYITMTTVGYGDLTPTTVKGRLHAIVWMLIGLALMSLIIGNLSSLFIVTFVFHPISIDTKEKVLVSDDAFMLAVKFFGQKIKIGNTSDGAFVRRQMDNGNVSKLFIDIYKATSIRSFINSSTMVLDEVKDVQSSYGIILSGELKRTSKCVKKYIDERNIKLAQQLSDSTAVFTKSAQSSRNLVKYITTSDSNIMNGFIQYGAYLLGLLVLIGITFELIRIFRGRSKTAPLKSETEVLFNSMNGAVEAFSNRVESIFNEGYVRQIHERIKLRKLQNASVEHVILKMYPDLSAFDTTLPHRRRKSELPSKAYEYDYDSEEYDSGKSESPSKGYDSESSEEGEIDYKTS